MSNIKYAIKVPMMEDAPWLYVCNANPDTPGFLEAQLYDTLCEAQHAAKIWNKFTIVQIDLDKDGNPGEVANHIDYDVSV